jgi:hypothetical protein
MFTTSAAVWTAWIVIALSIMADSDAQPLNCTPCDIPMSFEAGLKAFGGVNCSEWEEEAMIDPSDSEMCLLNRIAGVAFCGCAVPEAVTETCQLCPNGSMDVSLNRELPDVPGVTCADILQVPKIDGDESCSLLQAKYAFWCDCPKVTPACTLCPRGSFPPKPDKALPFDTNLFCGDIATEFLVSTPQQCQELKSEIPIDLAAYCECPGTVAPDTCMLCPLGSYVNEYVVIDDDLTCADIHQIGRFATNETVCDVIDQVTDDCCSVDESYTVAIDGNNNPQNQAVSTAVRAIAGCNHYTNIIVMISSVVMSALFLNY